MHLAFVYLALSSGVCHHLAPSDHHCCLSFAPPLAMLTPPIVCCCCRRHLSLFFFFFFFPIYHRSVQLAGCRRTAAFAAALAAGIISPIYKLSVILRRLPRRRRLPAAAAFFCCHYRLSAHQARLPACLLRRVRPGTRQTVPRLVHQPGCCPLLAVRHSTRQTSGWLPWAYHYQSSDYHHHHHHP